MIDDEQARVDFGCEHCWPADPDAAWEARRALAPVVELVDESHFHVMVLACGRCAQRFVSIFTETVDWAEGEDPQYWTLLPVTAAEAAELVQRQGPVTETQLNALGPGRRCLRSEYPKGEAPRTLWSAGISVGPHD